MASPVGLIRSAILSPEGKIEDPTNPGVFSQIILVLQSPWQIQFWGGSGYTRVYGGKIVGGLSDRPMKATGTAGDITVLESPVDGVYVAGEGGSVPTAEEVAGAVWDEDLTAHNAEKTAGATLQGEGYHNAVVIDSINGVSGTAWPIGTHGKPVSNLTDALSIMATREIDRILLHTSVTIEATHNVDGMIIETMGIMGTTVTFAVGCSANNAAIRYAEITGVLTNGDVLLVESCQISNLANFTGIMNVVNLQDGAEISIGIWASIIQATGGGAPTNEPEIMLGTASVGFSHYTGNLKLMGKTGGVRTVVNCASGNILIDATCTGGTIQLLGIGIIESDLSGAGCQVDADGFVSVENVSDAVWDEVLTGTTHNVPSSSGRRLRQLGDVISASVVDVSPGIASFDTDAPSTVDDFYLDQTIRFSSGNLEGQIRIVLAYDGTNKTITVDEAWTEAPANGDEFDLLPQHSHPISQIAAGVWEADVAVHAGVNGSFAELLDFVRDIEGGRWMIDEGTNQMVFYADDNLTEVARFNLLDSGGSPASEDVYERTRV